MFSRPYVQGPGWNSGMNLDLQADYLGINIELRAISPATNTANKKREREKSILWNKIKKFYI